METGPMPARTGPEVSVRLLREADLATADQIRRLAFGTFLGLADPLTFRADQNSVRTRWLADPTAAFAAELSGELVGSNFAVNWGSVGFFGPLTIRPDLWNRGIAGRLLEPIIECFDRWRTRQAGLFTFANSPKHVGLYQKYGFWPRFLTAIMAKPVMPAASTVPWSAYSDLAASARAGCLAECRELTEAVYEGLDVSLEIRAVAAHRFGDTVLLQDGARLVGLAVCHCGPDTEAGSETCYVKFGAVRPGPRADEHFGRLLEACAALAAARGLSRLVAGVNLARHDAYRQMLGRGFRTEVQGVAMHRPDEPGYNRPDVYLIDDWR